MPAKLAARKGAASPVARRPIVRPLITRVEIDECCSPSWAASRRFSSLSWSRVRNCSRRRWPFREDWSAFRCLFLFSEFLHVSDFTPFAGLKALSQGMKWIEFLKRAFTTRYVGCWRGSGAAAMENRALMIRCWGRRGFHRWSLRKAGEAGGVAEDAAEILAADTEEE